MLKRQQKKTSAGGEDAGLADLTMACDGWTALVPEAEIWAGRTLRATLEGAGEGAGAGRAKRGMIAVLMADDAALRDLNRRFRGQDKPTNVLSFPARALPQGQAPDFLGDIAFALETVQREAEAARKPVLDHLTHLLVHGTLHLLGYTHNEDADAVPMMRIETAVLARLGIADPYAAEPCAAETQAGAA